MRAQDKSFIDKLEDSALERVKKDVKYKEKINL